ncbi:MAG: hypothetical protein IH881_16325 [Myxococcales bacterium]|nr:hypothetical protein [Myxococcales bacterium]
MLMACLDGAAGDLQIMLTLLARPALIIDGAEPPETRFPKLVRDVLGTPRLKKRSEDVHEQERSAEVYYAGSQFTEGQFSKFETPELLDPEFKLSRKYIRQGILGKNADRAITDRLKTESNRIGLTPKNPVDEEEAKLLDHIRRYPKEIEPESSDDLSDSADDEFVELAIPLVSHGKMGMPLVAQIAHDVQIELACGWLVEFESSLPNRLRPLHQLHFGDTGIGLTEARKQLGLKQSDENNYRNRLKHFCEKKAKDEQAL